MQTGRVADAMIKAGACGDKKRRDIEKGLVSPGALEPPHNSLALTLLFDALGFLYLILCSIYGLSASLISYETLGVYR